MVDSDLPEEVKRLIAESLSSMDHVEVLFHVYREGPVDAGRLATLVHLDRAVLQRVSRDLIGAGLIVDEAGVFRVTDVPKDRTVIERFAEMYNARPVTLVRAVYSRVSPVKTFADAFRIRRDD